MKKRSVKSNAVFFIFLVVFAFFALFSQGYAQNPTVLDAGISARNGSDIDKEFDVTIKDINLLMSGKTRIMLWGVEKLSPNVVLFNLKARKQLEEKINGEPVLCTIKGKSKNFFSGQCINREEEDLSMFLLQQGLVSADRTVIHDTIYETPYLQAEQMAQDNNRGVWSNEYSYMSVTGDKQSKNFMLGSFLLVAVFIMGLIVLGLFVMRGFGRVVDVHNRSIDLAIKERSLKDKEKMVIASMIGSEVLENKAKIEAYLIIYEEILRDFNDENKSAKYKKTGEIIQKQPSLSRTVFDGNTNKLDLFGAELSSNIIHYYARIKTNPDYIEISPETLTQEARDIVIVAIENARKLEVIAERLLEKVADHAAMCIVPSDESN